MSNKEIRGFKPTSKFKKILRGANAAWLYKDGIIIQEKTTAKLTAKTKVPVTIFHIIQCDIPIRLSCYRKDKKYGNDPESNIKAIRRLVFHNASLLIDGVEFIHIHYNNVSDGMIKKGITSTTVEIGTQSGMRINEDQYSFSASDITTQPNIPEVDPFSQNCDNIPDSVAGLESTYDRDEVAIVYDNKCKYIEP